jgi:uncharacterized damage-inducible protein DinB
MTVKDVETLFDYSYWANNKLWDVVARLTPEEFTKPIAGSYGSVRNTMVHMLSAEWGWLDRCGGAARGKALMAIDYPTKESVLSQWRQVEGNLRGFLGSLQDKDLERVVEFTLGEGPKHAMPIGALLHHAAIHGVHHRGQVSLLLRALGHAPGNVDILFYYGRR